MSHRSHRFVGRARAWIQATRTLSQVNIALPLLLGGVLAWRQTGTLNLPLLALVLAMGVADQWLIVFSNDLADEAGDRLNHTFNAFSGGSRVLPDGQLSRRALVRGCLVAGCALALMAVAGHQWFERPGLLFGWSVAVGLLWAYNFPPLRLSYRGGGPLAQAIGMGMVLPWLGFYAQQGSEVAFPMIVWLPLGLIALAGHLVTSLPDVPADTAVDKRTWPVIVGAIRARKHALLLLALGIVSTPLVLPGASRPTWAWVEALPLLALIIAARTWRTADPSDRSGSRRFILLFGVAGHGAIVAWIVVLAWPTT